MGGGVFRNLRLQGIQTEKSLQAGWIRVLSYNGVGLSSFVFISNYYNSDAPHALALLVQVSYNKGSITVLGYTRPDNKNIFDKVRLAKINNTTYYLDIHHNSTGSNRIITRNMIYGELIDTPYIVPETTEGETYYVTNMTETNIAISDVPDVDFQPTIE